MIKRQFLAAAFLAIVGFPQIIHAENSRLTVIVFPSVQNLPLFAADARGFYVKRGLNVDIKFTPNSDELRNGLAEGRYQIAHSAIDNAFALKDKAGVDIVVVAGGDNSFNHLIVQPEIGSFDDIKGKIVAVDAPDTAYAFQLYERLRQNGLNKGDYQPRPLGGTGLRLAAMSKDRSIVASLMAPPFSVEAVKAGFKDMGSTAAALGAYQGASTFALRAWTMTNSRTLVKYLQAEIEGFRWVLDPKIRRRRSPYSPSVCTYRRTLLKRHMKR